MAKQEQLNILQKGTETWDIWRQQHLGTFIDLSGAHLSGADLSGANLIGADLREASLIGADLREADLREAGLREADLREADLREADLFGADLREADLRKVTLSRAHLFGADLSRANLSGTNLFGADLSGTNLSGTNLSRADLSRADLREADLSRADLSGANLSRADLSGANLFGADLSGTNLLGADLSRANLSGANLSGANLIGANLSGANLSGADLSNTRTFLTHFDNIDLRDVKGLETIRHLGPSHISTSTLSRSQGDIPDLFLREVGLDDTFINYVRSLTSKPTEYYTCFICCSSKDEPFAGRLHHDLQQEGVRCWFAPEDMDVGDEFRYRIDESIRLYDKLLLILSEHSIASNWVEHEVQRALNKEPQGQPNVLYPIKVDKAIMTCTKTWAKDIKETRHIGDFENWIEPQQYKKSFKRLLRALNIKKKNQKA